MPCPPQPVDELKTLVGKIKTWGHGLGFAHVGVCDVDLSNTEEQLQRWLAKQYHGQMEYLARHGVKRTRPAELIAGTVRGDHREN